MKKHLRKLSVRKYPISFLLKCQNNDWKEDYVYNELPKSHLDLQFTHKIINIMLI